ncbi:hypothetical protein FRC19_006184 [Serendipita sp. 401]|nr:hypothetical protein FRC19_006184 [Serendipita sp. 401]
MPRILITPIALLNPSQNLEAKDIGRKCLEETTLQRERRQQKPRAVVELPDPFV